jgi:uncharacterized protein
MNIYVHDLADGLHEITSETTAKDLNLSDAEFYPNTIFLNIVIDKIQNLFRFTINIKSWVRFNCDRCLDFYESDFNERTEQIYQMGHSELDVDDQIELLPPDTREIDISKAISDALLLSRPMKLLCKPDCKGLCAHCGINLNDKACDCSDEEIDPRLQKLKIFLK